MFVAAVGFSQSEPDYEVMTQDTISNTGTVTFTLSKSYRNAVYAQVLVKTRVLSGTGGGTISYQTAGPNATTFYTFATDTIAASGTAYVTWEGILYGNQLKMSATGVGTQSTEVNAIAVIKRIP